MKVALALLVAAPAIAQADDVLVWTDAPLAYDAGGTAAVVLDPGARALGRAVPMHVVSETATAIEVEPRAGFACTELAVAPSKELANLRLFVSPRDLAPIVTAAWRDDWKDGGHVALEAGIPIDPVAREVVLFDRRIPVDTPATVVGTRYPDRAAATGVSATAPPPSPLYSFHGTVKLGNRKVFDEEWTAASVIRVPSRKKLGLVFSGLCVEGVVVVDTTAVGRAKVYAAPPPPNRTHAARAHRSRDYLPAGTAVTGDGGRHVVARLAVDVDVDRPTDLKAPACHDFDIGLADADPTAPHAPSALTLCAPASAVRTRR